MQAGQSLPDNQWNLDITAHNPRLYRGVVGNFSETIGTPAFQPRFEKLCENPRYLGYRLSGRYQEKLTDAFFADLRLTAQKGRAVDFSPAATASKTSPKSPVACRNSAFSSTTSAE